MISASSIGIGPRLVVLNISDPAHPTVIGQTGVLPNVVWDVVISGNYAYVADKEAGLRVIDVSSPVNPGERA